MQRLWEKQEFYEALKEMVNLANEKDRFLCKLILRKIKFCHESYSKYAKYLQASNFIKNKLQHRCFPVKLAKFLRTPISKNICERQILSGHCSFSKQVYLVCIFDEALLRKKFYQISWSKSLIYPC